MKSALTDPVLGFVHIPKTAGSSVLTALFQAVGAENSRMLLPYVIESGEKGLLRRHLCLRRSLLELRQTARHEAHRIMSRPNRSFRTVRVIAGHRPVWCFPRVRRDMRFAVLLRDPLERMASLYRFDRAKPLRKRGVVPAAKAAAAMPTFEAYAEKVLEAPERWESNPQCRYLHRSGDWQCAAEIMDRVFSVAAPVPDLPGFIDRIGNLIGMDLDRTVHVNRTERVPGDLDIGSCLRRRLEAHLDSDRRLYDLVAERCAAMPVAV